MLGFIKSLYFSKIFFVIVFGLAGLFLFSFWIPLLYSLTWILTAVFGILLFVDLSLLFMAKPLDAERILPEKFSNSDANPVILKIKNRRNFKMKVAIIDELPVQFQKRDFLIHLSLPAGANKQEEYFVNPTARGEYFFGNLNIFSASSLNLVKRRSIFNHNQMVKVYPSFIQMRELDFLAIDRKISEPGLKKIRRIGHTMEFEQIKTYIPGDDVRTINWKATAKQAQLMVNQFQDERAQPVYSVIDSGRVMKMPFEGLSLLDYAINSSLAFSNIALKKKDKAGLISFSDTMGILLKAASKSGQLHLIMEKLYNIKTNYKDTDFGILYAHLQKKVPQRSLLLLYTNFEHIEGLKKRLPYLKALARKHLLVVIFFENTTLETLKNKIPENIDEAAHQMMAEDFSNQKKLMQKELEKSGIQNLLTRPADLSINAINKYLEIKSRGLI